MNKNRIHTVFKLLTSRVIGLCSTPIMRVILFIPPVLVLLMLGILLWQFRFLPAQVPLYYSRPWGLEQLAHPNYLFVLPLGTLLWYIFGIILIHRRIFAYRVFAQILLISHAITALFATITLINILFLVG